MRLSTDATDDEILAVVDAWVDDLANSDYEAAFARTAHDPDSHWNPDLICTVINGYGLPDPRPDGRKFFVTPRSQARGPRHYREVDRDTEDETVVAYVWYDLPLNGEWSDLTATFRVERDGDELQVFLEEIHVF